MIDGGYDIQDYRDVNPNYGTKQDLVDLFRRAKELGLKVILDFVSTLKLFLRKSSSVTFGLRFQTTQVTNTNGSTNQQLEIQNTLTTTLGVLVPSTTTQAREICQTIG